MKFLLHNEENITFPAIRPAYQEGELLFERFRMLTPRDAKDSILGEGGTGIIHLVRDELLDRIVALKLPHESILRDPNARFDVIRETRQAIELTHPHIVRIHDFHENRRNWGISMQYVRGMNLDEWRHVGSAGTRRTIVTYDVDRIRSWITQLCDALIYAHEDAHMVHRDIKPKNLMLERWDDGHERLLLTDFGITQKLRLHTMMLSRVQSTDGKGSMGTLPYMSMQQIMGAAASISDDIYAVGATIYELLTGRPPFYEGSYAQIRTQVETVVPPSMTQRLHDFDIPAHDIPSVWEDAVSACLAKKPGDRPQSIRELRSLLELSGTPAVTMEDGHLREEIIIISKALVERGQEISALEAELDTLRRSIAESTPVDIPEGEWQTAYNDLKTNFNATRFLLDAAMSERDAYHESLGAMEQSHAALLHNYSLIEQEMIHLRELSPAADSGAEAIRLAEEAAGQRAAAAEREAESRVHQAESSAQAAINAVQEEVATRMRQVEEAAEQRASAAESEAATRIQLAESSAQERINAIQEEAAARIRQAEETATQRAATTEGEAAARIQQAEDSVQARIDAIHEEAAARIRQAEESTTQRAATAEGEAAARIQQAEDSVQARIDAIQEEAAAKIRQAEETATQRAASAESEAAARIRQAEDSVQARIDAIHEEAVAKIRQAEDAATQRAATAESEAAASIQRAETSAQNKIDAAQEEATDKIRQAEESAGQRIATAEGKAASHVAGKVQELEESGRVLRLKTARPLAEALAKLEAANQQLERLRTHRAATTGDEA